MAARKVTDLPPNAVVTVRFGHPRTSDVLQCEYLFPVLRLQIGTEADPFAIGVATLLYWQAFEQPCPWVMENIEAGTHEGWGPLIYDIAMELATENGRGLVASGRSTNHLASNVWEYYLAKRRSEVKIELLPEQYLAERKSKATHYIYRKSPSTTIEALGDRFKTIDEIIDIP